jgi:hypothetical protein
MERSCVSGPLKRASKEIIRYLPLRFYVFLNDTRAKPPYDTGAR